MWKGGQREKRESLSRNVVTTTRIAVAFFLPFLLWSSCWWGPLECFSGGITFIQSNSQASTECRCCSHSLGWYVYKDLLPFSWFAMVGIFVQMGYRVCLSLASSYCFPLYLLQGPTSQWGFI